MRISNPITSKTMWALYTGQLALSVAFWQLVHLEPQPAAWVFSVCLLLMALLPIIGVLNLAGLDRVLAGFAIARTGEAGLEYDFHASTKGGRGSLAQVRARRGHGDAPKDIGSNPVESDPKLQPASPPEGSEP